jgi:hypothetical protein
VDWFLNSGEIPCDVKELMFHQLKFYKVIESHSSLDQSFSNPYMAWMMSETCYSGTATVGKRIGGGEIGLTFGRKLNVSTGSKLRDYLLNP